MESNLTELSLEPNVVQKSPGKLDAKSYSFQLQDEAEWLTHLNTEGYVVLKNVLSSQEVDTAKSLLWRDLQLFQPRVSQNDVKTWDEMRVARRGIEPTLAQTEGSWFVRGVPAVHQAFAKVWDTEDLLVSMDCLLIWRPWWQNNNWKPQTEGLHVDQNPFSKPTRVCVQGMVSLHSVTDVIGGLEVVPRSHTDSAKADFKQRYPGLRSRGDWCLLDSDDSSYNDTVLLLTDPGDLILWDSRTVHGGHVGTGIPPLTPPEETSEDQKVNELARLSVAVAMTPKSWASTECQKARVKGFMRGNNFNHSPHEAGTSTGTVRGLVPKAFSPPFLNNHQRALLGGNLPKKYTQKWDEKVQEKEA